MKLSSAIALALLLFALPARAGDHVRLRYEVNWSGFHAADLELELKEGDGRHLSSLAMETRGLVNWLIKLRFDANAEGVSAAGGPRSLAYRTEFTNRNGRRRLELAFDPASGKSEIVTDIKLGNAPTGESADPEQVEPVLMEERLGALDPLTAINRLQESTRLATHGQGPKAFAIPVFDGRRRYDFAAEVLGSKRLHVAGKPYQIIEVRLSMITLQGFRPKHRKMWDGTHFLVRLDPHRNFTPVQIQSDGFFASTMINLIESCEGDEGCRIER
ncbi:MAG: DUF3108 domain-containing protein [Alphaproteobacteria bacterium]|nr:DUF3108 domain-containing protein [Alphaproteobacteria bacterium]